MNRILSICNSLSSEGLNGVNVFLKLIVHTFTMERFASIHFLHGTAIFCKHSPPVSTSLKDSTKAYQCKPYQ